MTSETPDMLYHYTSVESLALILRSKRIRFSPLTALDDPQEQRLRSARNLAKCVFVSSWTDSEKELYAMWREYTPLRAGVRIGLPANPFAYHENMPDELEKAMGIPCYDEAGETGYYKTRVKLADLCGSGFLLSENDPKSAILHQVKYSDIADELFPSLLSVEPDGNVRIETGVCGTVKNTYWEHQSEWRYKLTVIPIDILDCPDDMRREAAIARIQAFLTDQIDVDMPPYYELDLDDSALSGIEIVLSPDISPGNRLIVQLLLDTYIPGHVAQDSDIELS